jgi:hypothetical protein
MATARQRLLKVVGFVHRTMLTSLHPGATTCLQEYKEATKQKAVDTGITLIPNEQNLFSWRALLKVGTCPCTDSLTRIIQH